MNKTITIWFSSTFAIFSTCLSFIPQDFFSRIWFEIPISSYWIETLNKIFFLFGIGLLIGIIIFLWINLRNSIIIKGHNYEIKIEYGDIFKIKNCNKVISFDECFSTEVGRLPHQIKPNSICGQFLIKHKNINIRSLINEQGLKPLTKRSKQMGKLCYPCGSLIAYDDYLLMAFAKLDEVSRANFSFSEYTDTLRNLWFEIYKYYNQSDVAIPVLGSGITRFNDTELTQQQLIDIIIASYHLSPYKINNPHKLRIICKKAESFSLNNIGKSI